MHGSRYGYRRYEVPVDSRSPGPAGRRMAAGMPGMGVGLRNVAERLRARFGGRGALVCGEAAPGRFRAAIDLPWVSQ